MSQLELEQTYPAFKRSNERTEIFEQIHESNNWLTIENEGWHLPAIDEPKEDCGKWMAKGCLNYKKHHGEFAGKVYIKTFQKSCYRSSCQICYKKWIAYNRTWQTLKPLFLCFLQSIHSDCKFLWCVQSNQSP